MRPLGRALTQTNWYPYKRGNQDRHGQRKTLWRHRKLWLLHPKDRGHRRNQPCWPLDLGHPASRPLRKYISAVKATECICLILTSQIFPLSLLEPELSSLYTQCLLVWNEMKMWTIPLLVLVGIMRFPRKLVEELFSGDQPWWSLQSRQSAGGMHGTIPALCLSRSMSQQSHRAGSGSWAKHRQVQGEGQGPSTQTPHDRSEAKNLLKEMGVIGKLVKKETQKKNLVPKFIQDSR